MLNIKQDTTELFDMGHQKSFLDRLGWEIVHPVGQDSSIRRYYRVQKNQKTAILLESVPDDSPFATPGHSLADFVKISQWLSDIGLKPPSIYETDLNHGYILLEDFGRICFKEAAKQPGRKKSLYILAARVLEHIADTPCNLDLPDYYESHVHRRHRRVMDWYAPLSRGAAIEDGAVESYKDVWAQIENSLPPCPQGFLHIDFHAENLMWLPEEQGLKRCGILDFQGAMRGPVPYDLANLLEDARNDVPMELRNRILKNFDQDLQNWYRVMATQFHCRVIGQFIKQAVVNDNPSYLPHIPRLQNYINEGLKHPILAPLSAFFKEQGVDFNQEFDSSKLSTLPSLVSSDAQ